MVLILPVEIILLISKKLNNQDLQSFAKVCKYTYTSIIHETSIKDRKTRLIVSKIKEYRRTYDKKQRVYRLLQYHLYRPHVQKELHILYENDRKYLNKFNMIISYSNNYRQINIKIYGGTNEVNYTYAFSGMPFEPEKLDLDFMCQWLLSIIEKNDLELNSVKIKRTLVYKK